MHAPRNFFNALTLATTLPLLGTAASEATILINLEPKDALYDSDKLGLVNDTTGPADLAGHPSGVKVLDTAEHPAGFTFNISFVPTAADLNGTRLLIEIGATSNGSGLYLVNGVLTFIGKQGASDAALPTGLNDTTLNTIAVQSSAGKLIANTAYSASASWNHLGTLELKITEDTGSPLLNSFAISGAVGNWSGNDTLSVKTISRTNLGGLSGNNAANVFGLPFDVDDAQNFQGTVSRALFWNANAVTPLTKTVPVVKGFHVTKLPTSNKVRLHWNVTEGGLTNPTSLVIKDGANDSTVFTPSGLVGFTDLPAGVANFKLTATNSTGEVSVTSAVEADNSFTTTVRADAPSAWFRFNEIAGSSLLTDSSESTTPHDGTLLGSPVTGTTSFIDGVGAFEGGSAVTSNPILDIGTLPAPASPATHKGFSIETVVRRRAGAAGNHVIVSQTDVNGVGRAILGIAENGTIYSQVGVATPTAEGMPNVAAERKEADVKLDTDRWAHLVLVVDAGTGSPGTAEIRWYLDGVKIGSTLDGVNPDGSTFTKDFILETSSGNWVIGSGKSLSSEFWKGDIDDVAIYPKLLDDPNAIGDVTNSIVASHYNSWYAKTSGILSFKGSSAVASTGGEVALTVRVGADVSQVSIDGVNVELHDHVGTYTVHPSATTTYRATAIGTGGPYTQDFTVTYQQLTAPVILGFEKTTLPGTDQVRLHWRVSAGAFDTPTTITLDSNGTEIPNSGELNGFVDVSAAVGANVTLKAKNLIDEVTKAVGAAAPDTAFSAQVRQDKPIAWFRFNEQSGSNLIVDSAENAKPHNGAPLTASVSNGATGFIDGAGTFDGARGVLADKILSLGEVDTGYTIEAIVKAEPVPGGTANRAIVSQQDLNGTGRLIISVDESGTIRSVLGAGGVRKDADTKVPAQEWSHLVIVVNAFTNEIHWYVDGQPAGTSKDGLNPDGSQFDPTALFEASNGAWTIGVHKTLTGNFWKGQIDEIAVYDTVLDELPPAPGADPNEPAVIDTTRIVAHRNAWRSEATGIISTKVSASTINAGQSSEVTLDLGADVTAVNISPGIGNVNIVNGKATAILSPAVTTTYDITVTGAGGSTVTTSITITVNGSATVTPQLVSWSRDAGHFTLNISGTPNTTYYVRGSTDLLTFPLSHGTILTDGTGLGTVTIDVDPGKTKEFFRVQTAP
jgi:hypothetical protein